MDHPEASADVETSTELARAGQPTDVARGSEATGVIALDGLRLWLTGGLGVAAIGAGAIAVFITENDVGAAALLAIGVYFFIAAIVGAFPKLKVGDTEIDPTDLRTTRQVSQDAKLNSEDAKEGLADTRHRLEALEEAIASLSPTLPPVEDDREVSPVVNPVLARLAAQYNEVRWTMPSGPQRTTEMTAIMNRMIDVARNADIDPESLLRSKDRGLRLAGVACVNARPSVEVLPLLAEVALTPDKPFNEYWALQTLRKVLHNRCDYLDANLRHRLQERARSLPAASDRARVINGLLSDCP